MSISKTSDLACLAEATRLLTRRPWVSLGLATLGMALSALAPLLQLRAGLPDELMTSSLLIFVAVFPLELYFIPRFLMEADAQAGANPGNPAEGWSAHFEERWLRAFLAKVLLAAGSFLGLLCLVVPGLVVLLAFGWVPMRVLLKGETLLAAAKGSLTMMAQSWRRMVFAVSALALTYLAMGMFLGTLVDLAVPQATLWQRLTHPILWLGNFTASLLSLWFSAGFLALFRRLDQPPVAQ